MERYRDRANAGQVLAALVAERGFDRPVILALPRGGVPVAAEVARRIAAPLDLVMVRKIGVPGQPEVAAGAVVDGDRPEIVVNEGIARHLHLAPADLERLAKPELDTIAKRRALYLKGRAPVALAGRTAVVVDDGIATGATVRAALRAVGRQRPARVVLAVPVAAADSLAVLRHEVDEVICPMVPAHFGAVGAFYEHFDQTSDDEVIRLMAETPSDPPE